MYDDSTATGNVTSKSSGGSDVNMPRLRDLNAYFIRYETRVETWDVIDGEADTWQERGCPIKPFTGPKEYQILVLTLADAQGVMFQCPKCDGHYCSVTFEGRGVTDNQGTHNSEDKPVRWTVTGTGMDDLTTKPSIQLIGSCNWHGYITNGIAR